MKSQSLPDSFRHAFDGIFAVIKKERNMKIHVFCAVLVLAFGLLFRISRVEWFICIGWIAAVLCAELFNTAIEIALDLAMPALDPRVKLAKDASAGAVLVLAIGAAISAASIFLPGIFALFP